MLEMKEKLPLPLGEGRGEGTLPGIKKARALRKVMTEAEKFFWRYIRDRQLSGYKFRRQVPISQYTADFACIENKVIVEIDGGQHNESAQDMVRDEFLRSLGYVVVRFWNNDVLQNIEGVLSTLTLTLSQRERELGLKEEKKCLRSKISTSPLPAAKS